MPILEILVLLVGGSVISFMLFGAYRFAKEEAETTKNTDLRE